MNVIIFNQTYTLSVIIFVIFIIFTVLQYILIVHVKTAVFVYIGFIFAVACVILSIVTELSFLMTVANLAVYSFAVRRRLVLAKRYQESLKKQKDIDKITIADL